MFRRVSIIKTINDKFAFLTSCDFTITQSHLRNEHCWSYSNNEYEIRVLYDDEVLSDMLKRNYNHKYVMEVIIAEKGVNRCLYDRYDLFGAEKVDLLKAQIGMLESQLPQANLLGRINLYAEFLRENIEQLLK